MRPKTYLCEELYNFDPFKENMSLIQIPKLQ